MDRSELLTLVFTDLVGSTSLKRERGDREAGALIARHRDTIKSLIGDANARIIDWAGDGCFLTFDAPSNAVLFALSLQDVHAQDAELPQVRVGVHLGEVTITQLGVEGLAVDLTARVCGLAMPGQILLSRHAFDSARQRIRSDDGGRPITWRAHGPYFFKGNDEAIEICEAGREGTAPLESPPNSEKARRSVDQIEEDALRWWPAVGLTVPGRPHWVLQKPLGQGGFGEVWLAAHEKIHSLRVFKFCFEPERIRGLRREVVLLRLLQESLGTRPDIARILDWEFDTAPYFIESEYTEGGDLQNWAERSGGLSTIPMETRLELVAQIADALSAAHSAGVLHKDIKPSNVLIDTQVADNPRICITDFGIGLVTDRDLLRQKGITSTGLTESLEPSSTSGSGTRMYMAPEVIEGKPASTKSDLYALGVLLYQIVRGDFSYSLSPGWERHIADDLLRDDIARCVDGDPARRLPAAEELAVRLRTLKQRRIQQEQDRRNAKATELRRRVLAYAAPAAMVSILVTIAIAMVAERWAQGFREEAIKGAREYRLRERAERQTYVASIKLAENLIHSNDTDEARKILNAVDPKYRKWEWGYLALKASPADESSAADPASDTRSAAELWRGTTAQLYRLVSNHNAPVLAVDFSPDNKLLATFGQDGVVALSNWVDGQTVWRHEGKWTGGGFARFSHDGKTLAFLDDRDVVFRDISNGRDIARVAGLTSNIETGVFALGDRRFVGATTDGGVRAWKVDSGELAWAFAGQSADGTAGDKPRPMLLGVNRDATQIFVADGSGTIRSVDASTGAATGVLPLRYSSELQPVCLIGDADSLIAYDAKAMCHRILGGNGSETKNVEHLVSAGQFIRNGVVSRDGSICFLRNGLGGIVPLDLEVSGVSVTNSEALVRGLTKFAGVDAVTLSPNGAFLAAPQADGSVVVYAPVRSAGAAPVMNQSAPVYLARFDPVHRRVVTADRNGGLVAWDVDKHTMLRRWSGHSDGITGLEPSPDYTRWLTHSYDGSDALWSSDSSEPIHTFKNGIPPQLAGGAQGPLVRVSASVFASRRFSPDGRRILVTGSDGAVNVVDASTFQPLFSLAGHQAYAYHVTFSPKGTLIATHEFEGTTIRISDAATGKEKFLLQSDTPIASFQISSGETTVAATTNTSAILRWNLADGTAMDPIQTNRRAWNAIGFSPKGHYFATCASDGAVALWHTRVGQRFAELLGHQGSALAVRFNPREDRLLTLGLDKTLRVWDFQGNQLLEMEFADDLYFADWSPDGNQIVLTSHDGSVRLFDSLRQGKLPR